MRSRGSSNWLGRADNGGVRKRARFIPTRWLEVADSPAAAAAILFAMLCSVGVGSCTSSYRGAPVAKPTPREIETRPAEPARAEGEPILRVRLLGDVRDVVLSGPKSLTIGPEGKPTAARSLATPVKVLRLETGWLLRDGADRPVAFGNPAQGAAEALSVRPAVPGLIKVNDAPYPGEFTLLPKAPRAASQPASPAPAVGTTGAPGTPPPAPSNVLPFDLVEHVALETYLPGVISRELLPNWSLTAFKAQAIAARSYAMHERERSLKAGEAFDLESSQLDQVYGGAVDHAVANRAVAETRGMILTFQGHVLRAYYSSTCGGRPAAAKDVWPTTRGFEFNLDAPIQGVQGPETACGYSPRSTWSVARSREDISKRLAAYGRDQNLAVRGLRLLVRIEPLNCTNDGRPTSYRLFDSDGAWYMLSAEQVRTGCNWIGTSGRPPVTAQTRVLSGDLTMTTKGTDFIIEGRGFGHGVGLCQYGAEGRARAGETAEQIVRHYYPGARLEKVY